MFQTSSSKFLGYPATDAADHHVAFTTVEAGNMSMTVLARPNTVQDSEAARRAVEDDLGITPGSTQFVSQIHSSRVADAASQGWAVQDTLESADAIVSVTGKDPIAVLVADCLPIAFTTNYGPSAVAHAGRVGLLDGVIENTVARLRQLDPTGQGNITAIIGPGICGKCYEVPHQMRADATDHHPNIASETSWGTPALDLSAAAADILTSLNVAVIQSGYCTYTDQQFYSHRRQPGVGRFAAFVWSETKTT